MPRAAVVRHPVVLAIGERAGDDDVEDGAVSVLLVLGRVADDEDVCRGLPDQLGDRGDMFK